MASQKQHKVVNMKGYDLVYTLRVNGTKLELRLFESLFTPTAFGGNVVYGEVSDREKPYVNLHAHDLLLLYGLQLAHRRKSSE